MLERSCILLSMNKLKPEKQAAVVRCLVEGNSIRSTVRITGVAKNTVTKLLVDLGWACWEYQSRVLRGITSKRVQCDEIWSFVGCKEKSLPEEERGGFGRGDVYTWTGMDADTKLMISWFVADRGPDAAQAFIDDLATRLAHRVQLTTDGHGAYLQAVEGAFGAEVDYGVLMKLYGISDEGEKRYSPAVCLSAKKERVQGNPDRAHISTSFVERQNLTMRMGMRRFTRLTNAFSKRLDNHCCAVSLHFMWYNFGRPHQSLREKPGIGRTPAMAAKLADHVWTIEEIVGLLKSN